MSLKNSFKGHVIISMAIVLIVLASQFRVIDTYVEKYTDESIKRGAIIFATARGINALVSVAQTTTIEAGVIVSGSVSIGEILDPLNDLIERFSFIMTLVLGALVAIKVLLVISAHNFFNYLLITISALVIASIYFNRPREGEIVFKLFFLAAFVRFSLVVMVALNSVVDNVFFMDNVVTYEQEINLFKEDLKLDNFDSATVKIGFFKSLEQKVDRSVSSFLHLIVIFLLKSIVLPLLFFLMLYSGIKFIWRSNILMMCIFSSDKR